MNGLSRKTTPITRLRHTALKTRIRTFDKRPLYVPNGAFSTISLENPSRMLNRRIKTSVGLRYQDAPKISQILGDIETMLREHPEIDAN